MPSCLNLFIDQNKGAPSMVEMWPRQCGALVAVDQERRWVLKGGGLLRVSEWLSLWSLWAVGSPWSQDPCSRAFSLWFCDPEKCRASPVLKFNLRGTVSTLRCFCSDIQTRLFFPICSSRVLQSEFQILPGHMEGLQDPWGHLLPPLFLPRSLAHCVFLVPATPL